MKLRNVCRKHISYVELEKDGNTPIGISVKDGTKYGLRPMIKNIKNQSLSHRSYCVAEGDVILSICGEDSKGMGRKEVRRCLKEKGPCIELKLEYETREACFDHFGIYRYDRMSLKIRKESGSFGFILRKNDSVDSSYAAEYPTITNIRPGGPADKEKMLKDGDRLLKIDDQSVSWLPLREVSKIFREKEEATFLFEYNTAIFDFCLKDGEKTELEIDCPDTELGMVLGSSLDDGKIFVQEIRQGSLAQRCGAFHVRDVILLINDIDTALLTVSKANSLLQRFKKEPGKLVFVPYVRGEQQQEKSETDDIKMERGHNFSSNTYIKVDPLQKLLKSHSNSRSLSSTTSNEGSGSAPSLNSSPKKSHPQGLLSKHHYTFNSPASFHETIFLETNKSSRTFQSDLDAHNFQTKTISMFREIVQNVSNMQHFISHFDNEVKRTAEKDVDTSNAPSEHTPTMDRGKFSQLKAIFTQTKNLAYAFCMHLVKNFKMLPSSSSASTSNVNRKGATTSDLIHQVIGDLIEIHLKQFLTKGSVDELSARLDAVELDCWECHKSCFTAFLLTQKTLLLLSFSEPDVNMRYTIQLFIQNLMKLRIPCDDCKKPWCSVSQTEELVQNSPSEPIITLNTSSPINKTYQQHTKTNNRNSPLLSEIECLQDDTEPIIGLDVRTENAFYIPGKFSELHSVSESNSNKDKTSDFSSESLDSALDALRPSAKCLEETYIQPGGGPEWLSDFKNAKRKVHRDKNLVRIPMQTWKSNPIFNPFSAKRCEFEMSTLTKAVPNHCSVFEEASAEHPLKKPSFPPSGEPSNIAESTFILKPTVQPTCSTPADVKPITKTQRNTTSIRLKNDGSGYGLNFAFSELSDGTPTVPVITAVHNQSAAQKCGILLKGDRLLEINGRNLVGLISPRIQAILREAFAADEVLLKVEFDATVPEIKYGTFNVTIDKTIKPGLEFKEFRKGAPLVVKGVVKGSAAHRSGLLFPGDEILFTKCVRQESYDSCNCSYKRTEMVTLTVRREPDKDPQEPLEVDVELESIPLDSKISNDFIIYRTLVRTVSGNDTPVLDHEFTLFPDRVQKDFGFLVGQNPTSGKVFVTGIRPGGPADKSKAMKKNDRILEVNGTIIGKNNKNSVLSLFMQDNDRMDLITRRILRN